MFGLCSWHVVCGCMLSPYVWHSHTSCECLVGMHECVGVVGLMCVSAVGVPCSLLWFWKGKAGRVRALCFPEVSKLPHLGLALQASPTLSLTHFLKLCPPSYSSGSEQSPGCGAPPCSCPENSVCLCVVCVHVHTHTTST